MVGKRVGRRGIQLMFCLGKPLRDFKGLVARFYNLLKATQRGRWEVSKVFLILGAIYPRAGAEFCPGQDRKKWKRPHSYSSI